MNEPASGSRAVALTAGFFALAGALEVALALAAPHPAGVEQLSLALGRGSLDVLLALGLARRSAVCRTIALVYCLASVTTYAVVLSLALGGAPLRFPEAVVVQSLFEVPSCSVLFLYLRSPRASLVFTRPLL
jgi:hypothetical protein